MKYIWLGIKDYCKDVWHDFWFRFWNSLWDFSRRRTFRCYDWGYNEGCFTKEGNLWFYIKNRHIAQKRKDEKIEHK